MKKRDGRKVIDQAIEIASSFEKYDNRTIAMKIRELIISEDETINEYLSVIPHIIDHDIVNVLNDIVDEEKVHVGQLRYVLYNLDPSEEYKEEEGMEEANEQ